MWAQSLTAATNVYLQSLVVRADNGANTWQFYATGNAFRVYANFGAGTTIWQCDAATGSFTVLGTLYASVLSLSGFLGSASACSFDSYVATKTRFNCNGSDGINNAGTELTETVTTSWGQRHIKGGIICV